MTPQKIKDIASTNTQNNILVPCYMKINLREIEKGPQNNISSKSNAIAFNKHSFESLIYSYIKHYKILRLVATFLPRKKKDEKEKKKQQPRNNITRPIKA